MTESYILKIEMERASYSAGKTMSAPIFFKLGETFFPEYDWYDFPLPLLTWWVESLNSPADKVDFDFMDGPFFLSVTKSSKICTLRGFKRTSRGRTLIGKSTVDLTYFEREVRMAARELLKSVEKSKIQEDDLSALKKALT